MINYDHITISEATRIQQELRNRLSLDGLGKDIQTIAGADISFNKLSTTVYAGIVLLDFPSLKPIARSLVITEAHFPYVPGFLAFREVPALLKAWEQLPVKPDVLVVDGHGIAHPRRMGIAAHFGALTAQATIGCAKKLLYGKFSEPASEQFSYNEIYAQEEIIGYALRTKYKVKPVFISPGNVISMDESRHIIMQCTGRYRLPEPTRLAHETVNKFRTGELKEGYEAL